MTSAAYTIESCELADTTPPSRAPLRTVVVLLTGLPAAGKSTLLQHFLSAIHTSNHDVTSCFTSNVRVTAVFRLDDYYSDHHPLKPCCPRDGTSCATPVHADMPNFDPLMWRKASLDMYANVRNHLRHVLSVHHRSPVSASSLSALQLVVVEDNMHYYSMRARYWRLCREVAQANRCQAVSLALLELRLYVPLDVCLARNAHREARRRMVSLSHGDAKQGGAGDGQISVPELVIRGMHTCFDHGRLSRRSLTCVSHCSTLTTEDDPESKTAGMHSKNSADCYTHDAHWVATEMDRSGRLSAMPGRTDESDVLADVVVRVGCWGVASTPQPWALVILLTREHMCITKSPRQLDTGTRILTASDGPTNIFFSSVRNAVWTAEEQVHYLFALLHCDALARAFDTQGARLCPQHDSHNDVASCDASSRACDTPVCNTTSLESLVHKLDLVLRRAVREFCLVQSRSRRMCPGVDGTAEQLPWLHKLKRYTLTTFRARIAAMANHVSGSNSAHEDVSLEQSRRDEYINTVAHFKAALRVRLVDASMHDAFAVEDVS